LLPLGIPVGLATLASLSLAGSEIGRTLSWILQPILLVVGDMIAARQVFAGRYLESAFKRSRGSTLHSIDVTALVDAAMAAFPSWLRYLVAARLLLVTVGSVLVIVLLALPWSTPYFR
jgi:hypothetical protein